RERQILITTACAGTSGAAPQPTGRITTAAASAAISATEATDCTPHLGAGIRPSTRSETIRCATTAFSATSRMAPRANSSLHLPDKEQQQVRDLFAQLAERGFPVQNQTPHITLTF